MKEKNREEEKEPKPFNVILLGNVKSEKEARIHKLIKKKFAINQLKKLNQTSDNINDNKNLDDIMNSVDIHGETVNMKIYDNTSASKVFSYSNKSLSSAQGIILFYSVCDRNSFNVLKSNLYKIMSMNKYDFPMVMVGNDSDLPNRQVNYEEAKAFADSYGLSFYEVSINSGLGIEPMFLDLGEQVVFKKYGNNGNNNNKNNKSAFIRNNPMMNTDDNYYSNKKGQHISIYTSGDLYEDEFNQSIKEKMKKNTLMNSYISSKNKNKLKTNYRTFTNESEDSINNSFKNNISGNKSKKGFLIKSPNLVPDLESSSVVLSYRGSTKAQKIREAEIRMKRLKREKEMKTWWKKREKENLEYQKMLKEKEKKNLIEKIKEDKKIQKEKEKKVIEDNLRQIKLNYQQKKQNNKKAEKDLLTKKENLLQEKILEKKSNKEKLNKLREDIEIEEREKQNFLFKQRSTIINNSNKKNKNNNRNNTPNHNKNKNQNKKSKSTKDNKEDSTNISILDNEEQNVITRPPHNYLKKSDLIENYKNNSNIYRCLKCKLIPDILINESNQEIEIYCDHSYKNNLHYNITTYSNFIEQSLNHPIDNNNISCIYCQKYGNELSEDKNIFYCNKCNSYFCSDDEEIHRNLMHKIEENIKEKYLDTAKNKISEKKLNKKNSKLMMTPMRNKNNKVLFKQITTPLLYKKTNNKINPNNNLNKDIISNTTNDSNKTTKNQKNDIKNILPFYLLDTYCPYHDSVFKFYCNDCHKNFCELCHKNHINHSIIKFDDILLSDDELDTKKNELNQAKEDLVKLNDYFTALIEAIKCKFERLFNIKKKELEIKEKIIHDYETIKYNYHSINNIRNIKFNNNDNFMELSPDTDWFNRFNLIFKYLNSNLKINNNDILDILNSTNEKNEIKLIQKNKCIKDINKLIILNNEDIAALSENKNIIIFDKDNLEEKLNIKISEKNNCFINDIILRNDGSLICCGYEFIKFINLGLDNQYYNCEYDIKDISNNINSIIEFNNNIFISLNDNNKLKLWKKQKDKYTCIDLYNFANDNNIKEEINHIIKINTNSFILSCYKEKCLCKFNITKNDKFEFENKLENINLRYNKYNNIILTNENFIIAPCIESLLLIDKNDLNIIQKFEHNYNFIDICLYSNKYIIALDSYNIIYKFELNKNQQKLFFEEKINLNDKCQIYQDDINKIIFPKKKGDIILQTKRNFVKIFN